MNASSPTLEAGINFTDTYRSADFTVAFGRELNQQVRNHWQNLLTSIQNPTLFQHPAWHEAFLHSHYDATSCGQLLFACISANDKPAALVPLLIRRTKRLGLSIRVVELMFNTDMGVRDFPIADDVDGSQLLTMLLYQALPAAAIQWDVALLPDLAENSPAYRAFQRLNHSKLAVYHHDSNRLRCGDEFAKPFAHISKSHAKKTQRKRKNLDTLGQVECELINGPAALAQALAQYVELENASWKGSAGECTSLHHDHPQKTFYESLMTNAAPLLNGCITVMRLDGKPIAINVCTRAGDTLWMLKITYDDSLQQYSPGNLMLLHLLEYFAGDEKIKYISFITGGDWTLRWRPECTPIYQCSIFNQTPAGLAILAQGKIIGLLRRVKHRLRKNNHPSDVNES